MRQVIEPGYHFEWVWLLRQYEKCGGDDMGAWITRLYDVGSRYGLSPDGFVFDELAVGMSVVKALASHLAAHRSVEGGRRSASRSHLAPLFANTTLSVLMDNFLDRPIGGSWIDHLNETRQPLVDYMPASSLYHLFLAAAEIESGFAF